METQQLNDLTDQLDLVIGELDAELPDGAPAGRTCYAWYCS